MPSKTTHVATVNRVRELSQDDGNYVLGWLAAAEDTTELEQALDAVDARNAREQVQPRSAT